MKRRRILLVLALIIIVILLVFSGLSIYVYKNKDDITRSILLRVNGQQNGELFFETLSFKPIAHFPDVSLSLRGVQYFENKNSRESEPILSLKEADFSFQIMDLLNREVNVSKIYLNEGNLNIKRHPDSTWNYQNALETQRRSSKETSLDSTNNKGLAINLEQISLRNLKINLNNQILNRNHEIQINNLLAGLTFNADSASYSIESELFIQNLIASEHYSITEKELTISSQVVRKKGEEKIIISPSKLGIGKSMFDVEGQMIMNAAKEIDLKVKGDFRDFQALRFMIPENSIKLIQSGELFFDGTVRGNFSNQMPEIDCRFGIRDMDIQVPGLDKDISNLNTRGHFVSGTRPDLSKARLSISRLEGSLPEGSISGSAEFSNLVNPRFDIELDLQSTTEPISSLFNLGKIDSLAGDIELKIDLEGEYRRRSQKMKNFRGSALLNFDSISFEISDSINIQNLNGTLEYRDSLLTITDLSTQLGKSDFLINGSVSNLYYLIFPGEREIVGDLIIKSDQYDFPDFFFWDPRTARAFPYVINDLELHVRPATSLSKLHNFSRTPEIHFPIDLLKAEPKGFLPPVTLEDGLFHLFEKDSTLLLDFTDFTIALEGSSVEADFHYESPRGQPDKMHGDVSVKKLNPGQAFVDWLPDTIPEYYFGDLGTDATFQIGLSAGTDQFDYVKLKASRFSFQNSEDTISSSSIQLDARQVSYNLKDTVNWIQTLKSNLSIDSRDIHWAPYDFVQAKFDLIADQGTFTATVKNSEFFDQRGSGSIVVQPFLSPPKYQVQYEVDSFDVATMLAQFRAEKILSGNMHLDVDVSFSGQDKEEILKSLDGKLLARGEYMTLHGIDLDELIERFKRSQRFTLADAGAIFLAGPVGLLVTKGSDYASMATIKKGTSSSVPQFSSSWVFTDGRVALEDVAFVTEQNRMAAKGWLDLNTDKLDVKIALVNQKGCILYEQKISGSTEKPDLGRVRVLKMLTAPVTNLVQSIGEDNCTVFYSGSVAHPAAAK